MGDFLPFLTLPLASTQLTDWIPQAENWGGVIFRKNCIDSLTQRVLTAQSLLITEIESDTTIVSLGHELHVLVLVLNFLFLS